ncbi:hypothetical protein Pfo_029339, partial [Paulownia fortunei]
DAAVISLKKFQYRLFGGLICLEECYLAVNLIIPFAKYANQLTNHLPSLGQTLKISGNGKWPISNLKEALAHIKICSRLEELLLRKKLIKNGGSAAAHNQKVDKLKILSESLASSASKAEKRISENRLQKEEALKFRVTKTSEVSLLEKVTTALTSARARLHNAREERDQFDEASNEIIQHFKLKDDELSKSIASYRAEAEVCNTFVNFLESTWNFQSSYTKQKEKLGK